MDQVYRIDYLRDKVLAALRKAERMQTVDELVVLLGLPYWAVLSGIDAALLANLVTYIPWKGYYAPKNKPISSVAGALVD